MGSSILRTIRLVHSKRMVPQKPSLLLSCGNDPQRRDPVRTLSSLGCAFAVMTVTACAASAQTRAPAAVPFEDPRVKRGLAHIVATEPRAIEEQIAICVIPAPPFKEQRRAED